MKTVTENTFQNLMFINNSTQYSKQPTSPPYWDHNYKNLPGTCSEVAILNLVGISKLFSIHACDTKLKYIFCNLTYFIQLSKRAIHLTKSRWPNEYDQNCWTWPKNWQQQTLTFEHDRKYNIFVELRINFIKSNSIKV